MTLQELYEKTLQRLGVIQAGESAAPEDTATVRDRYVGLYSLLNGLELTTWAQTADVPDQFEVPLVAMLAAHCAHEFQVQEPRYTQLLSEGGVSLPQISWAERQMRQLVAKKYVPTRAQSEYF